MKVFNRILKKINFRYYLPANLLFRKLSKETGLVFLMYHSIPEKDIDYAYATPISTFEQQMKLLSQYCKFISIDEARSMLIGDNRELLNKNLFIVVTFDDGYKNNITNAYRVMKKMDIPATIFLTTNFIEGPNETFLNWNECRKYSQEKLITFGAHTKNHFNLKSIETEDIKDEILDSKTIIENKLSKEVNYFAYPSGSYNELATNLVNDNFHLGFVDRCLSSKVDKSKINRISIDSRHNNSIKKFVVEIIMNNFYQEIEI